MEAGGGEEMGRNLECREAWISVDTLFFFPLERY